MANRQSKHPLVGQDSERNAKSFETADCVTGCQSGIRSCERPKGRRAYKAFLGHTCQSFFHCLCMLAVHGVNALHGAFYSLGARPSDPRRIGLGE